MKIMQSWSDLPARNRLLALLSAGLLAIAFLALLLERGLRAEDLWKDHNPYAAESALGAGSVLRLAIDEPVIVEYEYEENIDTKGTIKMSPDKSFADFLKDSSSDQSRIDSRKTKVRAKTQLKLDLAVVVTGFSGDLAQISGQKTLVYENGRSRQTINVKGQIHRKDVTGERLIQSANVANLELVLAGAPLPLSAGIGMKRDSEGRAKAELSQEEKEKLLLDYINRVLGGLGN
jgi:flagellar L-ring protein precursor FlgH